MHESALARRIVGVVLERAQQAGAGRVTVVRGWVSESEELSGDSLAMQFAAHARGTPAEGARLELRIERVDARCPACGQVFLPDHHVLVCPSCGDPGGELLGRVGLGVDTIEVES